MEFDRIYDPTYGTGEIEKLIALIEEENIEFNHVYDPSCGTGEIEKIIAFIKEENMEFDHIYDPTFGTEEFEKLMARQNEHLNQVATNIKKLDIFLQNITDEFSENITDEDFHNKKFDLVLSHPPSKPPNETIPTILSDNPHPQREEPWIYILNKSLSLLSDQGKSRGVFFLPITSLFSNEKRYKEIRNLFVSNDYISCIITLPNTFEFSKNTPGCIWVLTKNKKNEGIFRSQQILFINGKEILSQKYISNEDNEGFQENCCVNIQDLSEIINDKMCGITSEKYKKVERFFKYVEKEEIATKNYILSPELYTGYAEKPKVEYYINGGIKIKAAAFSQDNALAISFERDLFKQKEIKLNLEIPGVYILIGKQQELENLKGKTRLYIGETHNIIRRLKQHDKARKKTFWNSTVILTTINNEFPLDKSECLYLETELLQILKELEKVDIVNRRIGNSERIIAKEWKIYSLLNKYLYLLSELEITFFRP